MGYWVNLDSDMSRVHKECCGYVNPRQKSEGGWHHAETVDGVRVILKDRTRWQAAKCCSPELPETR